MVATLEEVARLAGVSRSTVSRVVNNHPNVRPEVRKRVWEVIQQVGYQPHAAARSLVTNRTQMLGLVIPQGLVTLFSDPFFPILIRGVADACTAPVLPYALVLQRPLPAGGTVPRALRSRLLDGVILSGAPLDDPLVPWLLQDNTPFVIAGRYPDERVTYVDVDNVGGARMAVEHLLRLGHRRIATITGPLTMMVGQGRLEGYRQALISRGIPVNDALIVEGDFTEEGARVAMQRLLPQRPTAVFVASDTMAVGAMKAIREAGLRIPDDVAIVGFDDLPIASAVEPPLTTVRQPIERMGAMAAEMLIGLVEGTLTGPQHIILPTQLIVRASCGSL